jgi:prepilin peptidase CpaA
LFKIFDPIVIAAVAASGGLSALVDLRTRRVPNPLTVGIALTGVALALLHVSSVSLPAALAGFAVGLLLMLPGHIIGATGAGDVKLFAALGTLLGPKGIFVAFIYTALAGGGMAVCVALTRRRLGLTMARTAALVRTGGANVAQIEHVSANNRFAYAPAIAVGTLIAALGF